MTNNCKFFVLFISIVSFYNCSAKDKSFAESIVTINKQACFDKEFYNKLNTRDYANKFINNLVNKYKKEHIDFIIASTLINTPAAFELLYDHIEHNCQEKQKARHYLLIAFKHKKEFFANRLLSALVGHKVEKNKINYPKSVTCLSCNEKRALIEALDYSKSLVNSLESIRELNRSNPNISHALSKEEIIDFLITHLNKHFKKRQDLSIVISLLIDTKASLDWLKKHLKKDICHYNQAKKYLYRSILKNKLPIACKLFNAGVILEQKKDRLFLKSILFKNILNPDYNLLKLLLKNGLSVNAKLDKQTALIFLLKSKHNNYKAAKFLIRNNIDINYKDKLGKTAFDYALELGDTKIINLLAIYGANITEEQKNLIFSKGLSTKDNNLIGLFGGYVKDNSLYLPEGPEYLEIKSPDGLDLI